MTCLVDFGRPSALGNIIVEGAAEAEEEFMKRNLGRLAIALLLLAGPGAAKHKEEQPDPRLKQIHTIFLKGAFEAIQQVQANPTEIGKDSCLKLADDAAAADAVVKVSYVPGGMEKISTANILNPDQAITQIHPYHTALEVSVREGAKMKKIWDKHIDLDRAQQGSRAGVFRLLDLLRQDACANR